MNQSDKTSDNVMQFVFVVAEWLGSRTLNQKVVGSNPCDPSTPSSKYTQYHRLQNVLASINHHILYIES
jgi:hypothetical protein